MGSVTPPRRLGTPSARRGVTVGCHGPRPHPHSPRRPRRRRRRGRLGRAAAARPARLRRATTTTSSCSGASSPTAARPTRSGFAMHLANGAAVRRGVRQRGSRAAAPGRRCAGRWPGWPSTWRPGRAPRRSSRVHPAAGELPELWGSGRAFAQATWRHLLFGTVLGELERRLNPPDSEPQPDRSRPPPPPTATGRPSTSSRSTDLPTSRPFVARVLRITGATGLRRAPPRRAPARPAGDDVIPAPPSSAADLRDPAAARALVADARPDVVYHLAARAHVGQSWEDPLGTLSDNVAMTAACSRRCAPRRPTRSSSSVGSGEEYGPPETVPTTEDAPAAPAEPVRGLEGVRRACSPASTPTRYGLRVIHARAFNHAGPGQEPIYAIANFARQFAEGLDGRRRPGRGRHRQPRHPPRLHRRPRRRPRLPHCSPRTASRASSTSAPASPRSARELIAALGEVAGVAVDHQVDPAKVRAHEVLEIRGSTSACTAATGWSPEIPLETDPRATPSPGGAKLKALTRLDKGGRHL